MVLQFRQYFPGVLLAHPRNLSARGGMPAAVLTFKNLLRVINPQREADRVRVMGPSPLGADLYLTAWPFRGAGMVLSVAKVWALATGAVSTECSTSQ